MELPSELREGPILVLSKDIILYYALYLPEAEDEAVSEHRRAADTRKPLHYDEKAASFYWALNIPVDALPYEKASEIQNHKQVCLKAIENWAPEFRHMLNIGEDDSNKTDFLVTQLRASTEPKADWRTRVRGAKHSQGHPRVWLLGDAVHAMQPNRGQGGNQALADCADMLPQLLHLNSLAKIGSAHPTLEEVRAACDSYEGAMISRAFPWVRKSGGVSFPRVNLDGLLGVSIRLVAQLVMPLLKLYYGLFGRRGEEQGVFVY